jgi:hypothetical protein
MAFGMAPDQSDRMKFQCDDESRCGQDENCEG